MDEGEDRAEPCREQLILDLASAQDRLAAVRSAMLKVDDLRDQLNRAKMLVQHLTRLHREAGWNLNVLLGAAKNAAAETARKATNYVARAEGVELHSSTGRDETAAARVDATHAKADGIVPCGEPPAGKRRKHDGRGRKGAVESG